MPDLSCPRCTSPDVRRFAILHKQGVTNSDSTSYAIGSVGSDLASGTISTSTVSTTKLARETAPPARKDVVTPGFFTILSALGLFSTFGMPGPWRVRWLVILLVSAPIFFWRRRYNRDVVPGLMSKWDRSFLCMRCGESFEQVT
ncbi:MAG: hypothetical protein FJ207_08595 [Gemmatimonadetes bacterium]|nr:hypothetical protein [Gemmatimonadota bacterium]